MQRYHRPWQRRLSRTATIIVVITFTAIIISNNIFLFLLRLLSRKYTRGTSIHKVSTKYISLIIYIECSFPCITPA